MFPVSSSCSNVSGLYDITPPTCSNVSGLHHTTPPHLFLLFHLPLHSKDLKLDTVFPALITAVLCDHHSSSCSLTMYSQVILDEHSVWWDSVSESVSSAQLPCPFEAQPIFQVHSHFWGRKEWDLGIVSMFLSHFLPVSLKLQSSPPVLPAQTQGALYSPCLLDNFHVMHSVHEGEKGVMEDLDYIGQF